MMCMILLNFLLGIIIDAFIEVKEKFQSSTSVSAELAELTPSTINAARWVQPSDGDMARALQATAAAELKRYAARHPHLNLGKMMNGDHEDEVDEAEWAAVVGSAGQEDAAEEPGDDDGKILKLGADKVYRLEDIDAVMKGVGVVPAKKRALCGGEKHAVHASTSDPEQAEMLSSPLTGAVMSRFGQADKSKEHESKNHRLRQHQDVMKLLAQTMSMVEKVASEVADIKMRVVSVEQAAAAASAGTKQ
jgi:hypothetical protein